VPHSGSPRVAADVNLIVAKADIVGGVRIRTEAPEMVEGPAGARLLVKFAYKFEEMSKAEDSFRVQLTSKLGKAAAAPALFEHRDRRGVADDKRGFVMQAYDLPKAGEHMLEWRAAAEYMHGAERIHKDLAGKVRVRVADGAPPRL
jgi:hypothetical protein